MSRFRLNWGGGAEPCDTSVAIADSLLTGERKAIFLGNIAEQHPQASQLHSLALMLSELTGACFGFISEAANSVGGYVANAVPTGLNAYEMFAQPRKAYVLLGVEADLDCHNPQMAMNALKQAALVVAMSPFKHKAALEYADVLLPTSPFTETSGTFVNAEGRVQSFAGIVKPLGDTRPAWKVLRVIGNLLGLSGFDYESSEQVRDVLIPKDSTFAEGLDNRIDELPLTLAGNHRKGELQRVAQVPVYFSDSLVRRATSLQMTKDSVAPALRVSTATISQFDLLDGMQVRVTQGDGHTILRVEIDEAVPLGCARVVTAHSSTASLGDMFGAISVERA